MKKVIMLKGGYFDGAMYGLVDENYLPEEILLHVYVNPRAEMQGITILGITKKGEDDITKVLSYKQEGGEIGGVLYYALEGEVNPNEVYKDEVTGELERMKGLP